MKYGRHQIDKAGQTILTSKKEEEVVLAIKKVNEWRKLHLTALDELQKAIIPTLNEKNINIQFTSRRLKRLTSIIYKLDINPEMKLGGMQDIGGLRIVVPTMDDLTIALKIITDNAPQNFKCCKIMNYIEEPKSSGYRSIHFIYQYISKDEDVNGMKVELQLRTKLQHNWAMAVETAGLITQTPLKSSQGDDKWLDFFKVVSSLFSIKEKTSIMSEHRVQGLNMKALMKILYITNQENKFCDTLKVLRVSNIQAKKEKYQNGYYLLNIDFTTKMVKITAFPKEEEEEASQTYGEQEKQIENEKNAVVLVSVPKMKELQEAYPSYFLDTSEFIQVIDTILDNCRKWNYT